MKQLKHIVTALAIATLGGSIWFGWSTSALEEDMVNDALNLVFFASLFVSFFCLRIALTSQGKIRFATIGFSAVLILLSTITWMNSSELFFLGKMSLAVLPLLLGSTLILLVNQPTKWSRILQILLGSVCVILSGFVLMGVNDYVLYTTVFVGLLIVSLATVIFLLISPRAN